MVVTVVGRAVGVLPARVVEYGYCVGLVARAL
jgi:hypothetical protein